MGRIFRIFLFLGLCWGSIQSFATGIVKDNRVDWSAELFSQDDLDSVGLIVASEDPMLQCSATLIKGHKIVTAAHCVRNFASLNTSQTFYFWPHFTANDHKQLLEEFPNQDLNLAFKSKAPVQALVFAVGDYTEKCETSKDASFNDYCTLQDWAVLNVVSSSIELPQGLDVMALPKSNKKQNVFMAPQYSQDRWLRLEGSGSTKYVINPSVDRACQIRDLKKNLAHTDCAMDAVGSGSPLLYKVKDKWYLVGIASLGPAGVLSTTPGQVFVEEKYIFNSIDTVYTISDNFINVIRIEALANLN